MSNRRKPAAVAAEDQLDACFAELDRYVNSLTAEDLLAELRCLTGRLLIQLAREHGPGSLEAIALRIVGTGIARFDLDGGTKSEPVPELRGAEKPPTVLDPHFVALPNAVKASEKCRCDTLDGGATRRLGEAHELVHRVMHAHYASEGD